MGHFQMHFFFLDALRDNKKILSGRLSECQTLCLHTKTNVASPSPLQRFQQLTKVPPSKERIHYLSKVDSLQKYYTIIDFNEVDMRIYLPEKVIIH